MYNVRAQRIEACLREAFSPFFLKIENESHHHSHHKGHSHDGETHFQIIIGANIFDEMGRIQREALIHQYLKQEWQQGLHALSIKFITKEQTKDYVG